MRREQMESPILTRLYKQIEGKRYGEIHTKVPLNQFSIYGRHLSVKAKWVYAILRSLDFNFKQDKEENNRVSYEVLAIITGLSVRSVQRAVAELEAFGWIEVTHCSRDANFYWTRDTYPKDLNGNIIVCPEEYEAEYYKKHNKAQEDEEGFIEPQNTETYVDDEVPF
jgi:hypothetical protein